MGLLKRVKNIENRMDKVEDAVNNHIPSLISDIAETNGKILLTVVDNQEKLGLIKDSLKHYKIWIGPP